MGEIINQENVHHLKKDDLIKTSKNIVGIVLSTTKDNIKILDMNNTIQIINNLDFDSKINSSLLLTKNRNNEQIRNNSIIRIRQGPHEVIYCHSVGFAMCRQTRLQGLRVPVQWLIGQDERDHCWEGGQLRGPGQDIRRHEEVPQQVQPQTRHERKGWRRGGLI